MAVSVQSSTRGDARAGAKSKKPVKPEKVHKVPYPGIDEDSEGRATIKLKEWPDDHDPERHYPLRRQDFEIDAPWLERRAERLEAMAKKLREQAEVSRKAGTRQRQVKVAKIERLKRLVAELEKGVEGDELVD
jgi:hypothetical protein